MKYLISSIFIFVSTFAIAAGSGDHSHNHEHKHGGGMYAVGEPAAGQIDRHISVSMLDTMRFVFSPTLETLESGESIKFTVRNDGKIKHEFSIGNTKEQMAHAEMMRRMPNLHHADPNTVSLEPGESATLAWKFMGKDTVVFACNIPGHFEAGMHHDVQISSL